MLRVLVGMVPPMTLPFGPSGAAGVPPVQVPGLAASMPKLALLISYCPLAGQGRRPLDAMKPRMASSTFCILLTLVEAFWRVFPASWPGSTETMTIAPTVSRTLICTSEKPADRPALGEKEYISARYLID